MTQGELKKYCCAFEKENKRNRNAVLATRYNGEVITNSSINPLQKRRRKIHALRPADVPVHHVPHLGCVAL
jgi:hypothetical protein